MAERFHKLPFKLEPDDTGLILRLPEGKLRGFGKDALGNFVLVLGPHDGGQRERLFAFVEHGARQAEHLPSRVEEVERGLSPDKAMLYACEVSLWRTMPKGRYPSMFTVFEIVERKSHAEEACAQAAP